MNIQRRYTFDITWKSYVLVWVSPLLFLIIPLITESYGQSDRGERSRASCWIRVERRTDLYVMLSVYYIPWFIIFMFCVYHVAIITWHTTSKYIYFKSKCVIDSIYIYIYIYIYVCIRICICTTFIYSCEHIYIVFKSFRVWSSNDHVVCEKDYALSYHFFRLLHAWYLFTCSHYFVP